MHAAPPRPIDDLKYAERITARVIRTAMSLSPSADVYSRHVGRMITNGLARSDDILYFYIFYVECCRRFARELPPQAIMQR